MNMPWRWKRLLTHAAVALGLVVALALVTFIPDFSKMDHLRIFTRAGWQLPERVIESLDLRPGDRVADIGAGDGYFTFFLADAVGENGKVYAVEVSEELVGALEKKARERGYHNVRVVLGQGDDPRLPDREIDLAFLCNVYHHIENRTTYFGRLRADLVPSGRIAVLDMRPSLLVRLLVPSGHWTSPDLLDDEMGRAGYSVSRSFDFLPAQSFTILALR